MAYESGNITRGNQSIIQRWALGYYQYSKKRDETERYSEVRKLLHFILRGTNDKLYELAYPRVEVDDPDVIPGHTYGVDDLEDLERLIKNIDGMQTKTQTELGRGEWSEWG